jgi:hypothetical protein
MQPTPVRCTAGIRRCNIGKEFIQNIIASTLTSYDEALLQILHG